jgi:hypothetical protein
MNQSPANSEAIAQTTALAPSEKQALTHRHPTLTLPAQPVDDPRLPIDIYELAERTSELSVLVKEAANQPVLPQEDGPNTPIAKLWYASRQLTASQSTPTDTKTKDNLLPKGEERQVNLTYILISLRLVVLLYRRFLALIFTGPHKARTGVWLAGRVVKGIMPALALWTWGAFLDEVQEIMQTRHVDVGRLAKVSLVSVSLAERGGVLMISLS